jgi:pyruvate,water dikinase
LARALGTAERLGLVVPETWVVVADVFRHVTHVALPPAHDPGSLVRMIHRPVGIERAARARERLLGVVLDNDVEREIDAAWRALSESAPWGLAVRASAILGDQGTARAAGLTHTELGVSGRTELGRAIRRVWALAASEATLSYLRSRKIRDLALAVVLQPVIPAAATVRLLTDARPLLGTDGTAAGSAPPRLAVALSGLDSQGVDPALSEVVQIDGSGAVRARRAAAQRRKLVVDKGALAWTEVGDSPGIDSSRLAELSEMARRVDTLGPTELVCVVPPKGEIAVSDLLFAQHLGHPAFGNAQTLWARAAVADVPAMPLTPLSRHLLADSARDRARKALGPGAPRSLRQAVAVSSVAGRSYLNISPFFEMEWSQGTIDPVGRIEIAGAQWSTELERAPIGRATLARVGLRLAQVATEQHALADDVKRFEREAEQERRWLAEMDLAILPDDALTTTLHEVREFVARADRLYTASHITVVGSHALLAQVLSTVDAQRAAFLAHAVTAGADVITARPATAFCHVAAIARLDGAAAERLASSDPPRSADALPDGPARRAISQFLSAYGDRGISEADLEVPRWGEDARPLLAMLAAALRSDPIDPDVALSRARALADRQLAVLEPRLSFFETRLLRDIASRHRELLRLRERCRVRVAHGLAMLRVVALDVDRRLRRLDPMLEPYSAMFLSPDELSSALAKYRADLAPVVRARRADLAAQRRLPEPSPVFRGVPAPAYPIRIDPIVHGLAASPGAGEGRVVRVGERLEGIERFSPGSVLVVKSLDLGFSPLFFSARAIVSELGTPLSSSVVVARDSGVPVVTGVVGAWVRFRDGESVRVDGDAGTVECFGS